MNSTWTCDLEDLSLLCLWFVWIFRLDWVWPDSIIIWLSWPKSNLIKLEPSSEFDSNSNFSDRNSDQIGLGYLPTPNYNDVFSNGFLNPIIVLLNRSLKTKYSIRLWNEIGGTWLFLLVSIFIDIFIFKTPTEKRMCIISIKRKCTLCLRIRVMF